MKRKIFGALFALVLVLGFILAMAVPAGASNFYEFYNSGDNVSKAVQGDTWRGQTFTADSNHSITSVKLKMFRQGNPGTVTVSIQPADKNDHPADVDLTSGSVAGDNLATTANSWCEIILTQPYTLVGGAKYAIVLKAPSGNSSNRVLWRANSAGGYAGGSMEQKVDGNDWVHFDMDCMFEVWGEPVTENLTESWVDDNWTGLLNGAEVTLPGGGTGHIGDDAFATIQDGINAVAGSTVHVAAGVYSPVSKIRINKDNLVLLGPQADVDPRLSSGSTRTAGSTEEAVVDGTDFNLFTIIEIDADNVIINGFEVKSGTGDIIYQGSAHGGTTVKYCIVHDGNGDDGIQLKQCTNGMLEYNYVYDIASPGDALSIADNSTDGKIRYNEARNIATANAAIHSYGSDNMEIVENLVDNVTQGNNKGGNGIRIGNKNGEDNNRSGGLVRGNIIRNVAKTGIEILTSHVTIEGNDVYHCGSEDGAIFLNYAITDITILSNSVHDNILSTASKDNPAGIFIENTVDAANVKVNFNNIYSNQPFGTTNEASALLDATCNYWGDSSGPSGEGNGEGDAVSLNVIYSPWLGQGIDEPLPWIFYVDDAGPEPAAGYIQTAVNAASEGDTVLVYPGDYSKGSTINQSLTVQSTAGWRDTTIDVSCGFYIGPDFGGDAIISGFTIAGAGYGIYINGLDGGSVDVSNCLIYNNVTGIYGAGTLDGDISINNCIISQNGTVTGIHLENVVGSVVITNSFIGGYWDAVEEESYLGNGGDGIAIDNISLNGTVIIDHNKIVDNGGNGIADIPPGCHGELIITNNVIGAYDYDLTDDDVGYFGGNANHGIYIDHVGVTGAVLIEGNKIAQNTNDGIRFGSVTIHGDVTINNNLIGAWTDYATDDGTVYTQQYAGNGSKGICAYTIASDGTMSITNNKIAENAMPIPDDTGIYIDSTSGDTTISNNYVGSWTQDIPGDEPVTYNGNGGPGILIEGVPDGSLLIQNNNVSKNTDTGIKVMNNDDGNGEVTTDNNTVDDNGTGGNGIWFQNVACATISGNTITNHIKGTDFYTGVYLGNSDNNSIINNTINENWIGVYIDSKSYYNDVASNVIQDNAQDGIQITGDGNNILWNDISGNKGAVGGPGCGILLSSDAEGNVINHNNITQNSDTWSYGVYYSNVDTISINAEDNWWGAASGPTHVDNPGGTGDNVSDGVDFDPWLGTQITWSTTQTVTGSDNVDATGGADTEVIVTGLGSVDVTVSRYGGNPGSQGFSGGIGFIDVMIRNAVNVDGIEIRLYYTDADIVGKVESSLRLQWWDGANWVGITPDDASGVNTADILVPPPAGAPYSGYMWAKISDNTTPNLTDLTGTPFGGGGTGAGAGGGGGGGGGGGLTLPTLKGLVATPMVKLDTEGKITARCVVQTTDGKLTLNIAKDTRLLDSLRRALTSLSAEPELSPPAPPSGAAIVLAYNFGPEGAVFMPAITMSMEYDPAAFPGDIAEQGLYIAYWDGSKWVALTTTVNTMTRTASCDVSHLTTFALIGSVTPPAPAAFSVSALSIYPLKVKPEEAVTITVAVANSGGTEGSYNVALKINGAIEAEESVTVAPGSSQSVSFSVAREEAGSYSVDVNGLSGSFTVAAAEAPPEAPIQIAWWIWVIVGVVVVGLIIFFVVRRMAY